MKFSRFLRVFPAVRPCSRTFNILAYCQFVVNNFFLTFSNFFKFFRCPAAPLCGDSFVILALFFAYVNIYFQIFSKKYSKFSYFFNCSYCITAESIEITRFYVYCEYSVNTFSVIDSCNVSIMPTEFFSDRRRFIKSIYIYVVF